VCAAVAARQGAGEAVVTGVVADVGEAITFEALGEAPEGRTDTGDLGDMAGGDVTRAGDRGAVIELETVRGGGGEGLVTKGDGVKAVRAWEIRRSIGGLEGSATVPGLTAEAHRAGVYHRWASLS